MGSFDPMLSSFTPTKYLGTINTSVCVTNYDQASLLIGTSSDLFNGFNTSVSCPRNLFRGIKKLKLFSLIII